MARYLVQAMRSVRVRWSVAGVVTAVVLVASLLTFRTLDRPTHVKTGSSGFPDQAIGDESLDEAVADPAVSPVSPTDQGSGVRPRKTLKGSLLGPSPIPGIPILNPKRGFELHVTTDKKVYVEDEQVNIVVRACNEGSANVTYGYWDKQPFMLMAVDSAGRYLASGTGTSSGDYRTRTWEPGTCQEFAGWIWWQTRWSISPEPVHGHPRVDAGSYRIEAQWRGDEDNSASPPHDIRGKSEPFELKGVVIRVTTDKPVYTSVERLTAIVTACNPSREAHTQTFVWDPEAEIRISKDGHIVSQTHNEGPVPKYSSTWAGSECRSYEYVWDQKATVYDPGGPDGEPTGNRVPPGEYLVEVLWWGHSRSDVGVGHDARPGVIPDRVPFTLI